jgi:ribonuclease VapC
VITVDTSALMAIVLHEPPGTACITSLRTEDRLLISAVTVAEALIVAQRRRASDQMEVLLDGLGFEIVPVTAQQAKRVADAYARWGKGAKSARLNFGDCFSYTVAKENNCPLLYVGRDFTATGIKSVL